MFKLNKAHADLINRDSFNCYFVVAIERRANERERKTKNYLSNYIFICSGITVEVTMSSIKFVYFYFLFFLNKTLKLFIKSLFYLDFTNSFV